MREVNYLRISLIDRCNFRCQYCMPSEEEIAWLDRDRVLADDELLFLLQHVFLPLGFNRFRLTGGEPLLRSGVIDLVRQMAQLDGLVDLAMTTNAYALADRAQALYDAGLTRINISLDSLNPSTFEQITGRDWWHRVWAGIQAAYRVGFNPLKLNVVTIPGVNDSEIEDLAALTIDRDWHIRFIEFMPIGNETLFSETGWIDSENLRQQIRVKYGLTESSVRGNGPADVFQIPGAKGTLGFISQMSECFCERCNRMRLSADGWLRPCLLNESGQVDLATSLRQGREPQWLQQQVLSVLQAKETIDFIQRDKGTSGLYTRTMSQIGG